MGTWVNSTMRLTEEGCPVYSLTQGRGGAYEEKGKAFPTNHSLSGSQGSH